MHSRCAHSTQTTTALLLERPMICYTGRERVPTGLHKEPQVHAERSATRLHDLLQSTGRCTGLHKEPQVQTATAEHTT